MATIEQHNNSDRINIAIDGPAGAGKSTVARRVASLLGYVYIDTGAMYRAVTLAAQRSGIGTSREDLLAELVSNLDITLKPGDPVQRVFLNGEDVTGLIRSREITAGVSAVAAVEPVRTSLVDKQRKLALAKGVVMDGRDIGSHVLPDAELKVFLTASVEERAKRRYKESGAEQGYTLEQLEREIAERDRMDEQRLVSPLVKAKDAVLLDSTNDTIDEVVQRILELSRGRIAEANSQ
ncbi:(d)CMP kinase [Paenibacillus sambharensis]|uniref:Cytidylate kinase n=1 Tax=Paenibacillus sambharensis TaxID=1803190 RepID=A0A2W1L2C2_9BACL|nr:(d)CMP kinase [Paenibacillus sambharensis]PZD93506.1 (d)CMP kinase [Paenibacillus sambharensis]